MAKRFGAQLEAQTRLARRRMDATLRQSAQEVIKTAQHPMAKGGRMRVKTGFLRNSGRIGIGDMPAGPVRNDSGESFDWDQDPDGLAETILAINNAPPGVAIFFGWTANYARARNAKDKFLDLAAQKWTRIVEKNARIARQAIR